MYERNDYSVLVVGAGSIGRRHMRNLRLLGIQDIAACDLRQDRLMPIVEELGVETFTDYEKAIAVINPDFVFVCTPPIHHVPNALLAVNAGAHVFIEKPISNNLEGIDELVTNAKKHRRTMQVGYNLRFHPGLQEVKRQLDNNIIGKVLWAQIEVGQYLPDWRPWQDYRQNYSACQELGGGIILDASHELDYAVWLLGQPKDVICMAGRVSNLEINVEDCATILLRFEDGTHADVHMDFVQRGYSRSCKLVGEFGTIIWDYAANYVKRYMAEANSWETISYKFDTNDMYIAELRHFLDCAEREITPLVELKQAENILKVALAAKLSSINGSLEHIL